MKIQLILGLFFPNNMKIQNFSFWRPGRMRITVSISGMLLDRSREHIAGELGSYITPQVGKRCTTHRSPLWLVTVAVAAVGVDQVTGNMALLDRIMITILIWTWISSLITQTEMIPPIAHRKTSVRKVHCCGLRHLLLCLHRKLLLPL